MFDSVGEGVLENGSAVEMMHGAIFADPCTDLLHALGSAYLAVQKARLAEVNRGVLSLQIPKALESMEAAERQIASRLKRALRQHVLWPWLEQYPGLGGAQTAQIIGRLRDPLRFGGARSVWHYCGLHVVNGRLAMQRKGERGDWNPRCRTAVLMPGGIAEQIVRLRVPKYRDIYDAAKARLALTRGAVPTAIDRSPVSEESGGLRGAGGADKTTVIDGGAGAPAPPSVTPTVIEAAVVRDALLGRRRRPVVEAGTDLLVASEELLGAGLSPIQIEKRARTIAAKAFVADLWRAWRNIMTGKEEVWHSPP